ncbi:hypothetical protein [Thermaerobacillus caldiproteolyticus]|uniref:Uncharacterized protein n=1 Tax=Thermaerobacillus caldiproteolyticus TaxID=247480 RepID=A0A7W0BZM7_9BACL|nr:hypothetical protein [Anoxybacillus caldiproteolyticus]MBA2876203.1 hypothetical protein [Anoxybacillus caldiproteolyticus]
MEQCLESYSNVRPIYEMVQDDHEAIRQADYQFVFTLAFPSAFRFKTAVLSICSALAQRFAGSKTCFSSPIQ